MMFDGRWLMFDGRWLMFDGGGLMADGRGLLFIVYCLLSIVYCLLSVVYCLLSINSGDKDRTFNSKFKITEFKICFFWVGRAAGTIETILFGWGRYCFQNMIRLSGDTCIPKRRTRGSQTPHAGIPNAARGDCQRRTRGFPMPSTASNDSFLRSLARFPP